MNNPYPLDTTSDMPDQLRGSSPPALGSVCPDCGSSNLRSVRFERGVKCTCNYWWIESLCCLACDRKHIAREQDSAAERQNNP